VSFDTIDSNVVSREGLRERLLVLRSIEWFDSFDDQALLLLSEHARTVNYRPGDVISRADDAPRAVHVVTAGKVTLSRNGRTTSFEPVTAFGAMAMLARKPTGFARAELPTTTLEIPAAALEAAIDESFSVLRATLRVAGAAVLNSRGNLPADPALLREVDEGSFHEQPRSFVERLIELRAGPFGYMNVEAMVDLARNMQEVRLRAGQLIWSQGDASTHAFHIDYGRVRCTSNDGRCVDVGRGFTIGVLDIWGAQGRVYEARAETDLIGFQVDFESFLTLLENHIEVGIDILRGFAASLLDEPGPSEAATASAPV
jgi:CRP-like cAMP-binding protein